MSCKNILYVAFALLIVGSLFAGSASATPITIVNASFDDSGDFVNPAPPWANIQSWTAGETYFTGIHGTPAKVGYMALPPAPYVLQSWQHLAATYQEGTYTLKAMFGAATGFGTYNGVCSLDGATSLNQYAVSATQAAPIGSLDELTAVLTIPAGDPRIGENIMVSLFSSDYQGSSYTIMGWDNVRLDFVPTPEPGTLALLATGLVGLLAYAWRKRK